ncbi:MAG TPA: heparan-alpha-glucosaminide N-acetyltransferase domain-containing protein [Verrucomicrobiae bacterium]|jgi:predicted acyltransferase
MPSQTEGASSPALPVNQRLMSVDALRGFDMFWIIGADSLVYALNDMSQTKPTKFLANQLNHADWAGFHFYDLIFPLFVFIVGVSLVFSLGKTIANVGRAEALKRIIIRSVLLFAMGIFYSGGFSHSWPDIRLMGVLNRIALAYFFSGLLFCFCKPRTLIAICASLLVGYWALMTFVPFPDVRPTPQTQIIEKESGFTKISQLNMASTNLLRGTFLKGVNLSNYIDQKYLPGRKYDGTWDPEGILSTLPAVGTCLLGVFAGLLLKNQKVKDQRKVIFLLSFGVASVALGWLWGIQFPVIKKIWTSSYVLVAGGYSAILLGVFFQIVDVWKWRKWCQPFVWMGMNSITIYIAGDILNGFDGLAERFVGGDITTFFDTSVTEGFGELMVSIVGLLLAFWFAHFLYKRKIFLRL